MAIDLREALVSQAASSVVVHANGALPPSPWRPDAYRATSRVAARNVAGVRATPDTVTLTSLHHPRLRLQIPLVLRIERENEHVTAWSDDLEEIGYGPSLGTAIEDFQRTVVELHQSLHDAQERLGPDLARLWRVLRMYVGERQ